MSKRGIELVELRNFKCDMVKDQLICSCAGNGYTAKAVVNMIDHRVINISLDDLILQCKYALADQIDPLYIQKNLYEDGDYEGMLGAVEKWIEDEDFIEASSWTIQKDIKGYKVSCCAKCGDQYYDSVKDAVDSLSVWPDQAYSVKVSWKDKYLFIHLTNNYYLCL